MRRRCGEFGGDNSERDVSRPKAFGSHHEALHVRRGEWRKIETEGRSAELPRRAAESVEEGVEEVRVIVATFT